MNENRTLNTLRSTNATLVVLVLALVAQMPHAADVFRLIVYGDGLAATVHSYAFAVALELAVLAYVPVVCGAVLLPLVTGGGR